MFEINVGAISKKIVTDEVAVGPCGWWKSIARGGNIVRPVAWGGKGGESVLKTTDATGFCGSLESFVGTVNTSGGDGSNYLFR
jgi:hypothetical protein